MRAPRTPNAAQCYANLATRMPSIRAVWPSWHAMVAEIGHPLPGQRLGRKRPSDPHGPGNTMWTSTHIRGLAALARKSQVPYATIYARLRRGASLREATKRPPRSYRRSRVTAADILRGANTP